MTRRESVGGLAALLLALVSAIVVTWPMAQHIDEVVLGGGELGGWLWRYDWHYRSLDGVLASGLGPVATWREFVGLGRHPETGNILDVLAISYPLDRTIGFPLSYNVKILLILTLNGVCGYAMARYFSGSISASLAASVVAVINPLTLTEVQACGLRQALLWWVLLYPALLDRALRRRNVAAGVTAGACLGIAAAFYWFYGLFTVVFSVVWFVQHVVAERARLDPRGLSRAVGGVVLGTLLGAGPFILPYAFPEGGGGGTGGTRAALPEMTFFLPFPSFDTISNAPMRPQTYAENILASINRTIGSSWSSTYPIDPTLDESLPLVVLVLGVVPALVRRRSWGWLAVWLFFYVGTLGPFLRIGDGDARAVYRVADEYVVRLPFTLMFQFIPGMSRMFAPYRLASFVVVASVALVGISIARLPGRRWLAALAIVGAILQPMYRWDKGAVNEGDADSRIWRSPIKANRVRVPELYVGYGADRELWGIVELPLEQQQDLICYYQIVHDKKVYRSWASPGAIPPALRAPKTGGAPGDLLRYQARPDVVNGPVPELWQALSRTPDGVEDSLGAADIARWGASNAYRRVIVHERGYYLVDPRRGATLYEAAVTHLSRAFDAPVEHLVEVRRGDPTRPVFGVPHAGDLLPWTSQPADIPPEVAPAVFRMAEFVIPVLEAAPTSAGAGAAARPPDEPLDSPTGSVD